MEEWLSRTRLLLGDAAIERLQHAHVMVVGVGGVGAYAAEMIVRAGVGRLTIVDGDTVAESNLNRQLVALHSTLGKPKTEILAARLLDINPGLRLTAEQRYLEVDDIPALLEREPIDFVVDAIDTLAPKVALITYCLRHKIRIVSSMGAGGRKDPSAHTSGRYRRHLPLRPGPGGAAAVAQSGYIERVENGIFDRAARPSRRRGRGGRAPQEVDRGHPLVSAGHLRVPPGQLCNPETYRDMIEIKNIHKSYGSLEVLKGIDAVIEQGEIVAIVGASGAGKTTLLQIVGTLDKPDCGEIRYDGKRVDNLPDREMARFRNGHIGFVFQFHQLLPEFTALENVMIPALIGGRNSSEAEREAKRILDFLSLGDRLGHKPAQLSGGEKQRVAVARALINRPSVILADEPSGSLDSKNKIELHKLFFDLRDEFKQTFVIVTHDETLAQMTDRILFMKDGAIVDPPEKEEVEV